MPQYTARNVPEALDRELRERAKRNGVSLNDAAIEAIKRGLCVVDIDETYGDLDGLAGTWQHDEVFDRAIAEQDTVDTVTRGSRDRNRHQPLSRLRRRRAGDRNYISNGSEDSHPVYCRSIAPSRIRGWISRCGKRTHL